MFLCLIKWSATSGNQPLVSNLLPKKPQVRSCTASLCCWTSESKYSSKIVWKLCQERMSCWAHRQKGTNMLLWQKYHQTPPKGDKHVVLSDTNMRQGQLSTWQVNVCCTGLGCNLYNNDDLRNNLYNNDDLCNNLLWFNDHFTKC